MSVFFFARRVFDAGSKQSAASGDDRIMTKAPMRQQLVLDMPKGRELCKRKMDAIRDALDDEPGMAVFVTSRARPGLHRSVRNGRIAALQKLTRRRRDTRPDQATAEFSVSDY